MQKAVICDRVPLLEKQKAGLQSCCSANSGSGIAFNSKQQH